MSNTPSHAPNTPMGEPDHRDDSSKRTLVVGWHIGTSDVEGWRPLARLAVHHTAGKGYTATLRATQIQKTDLALSEKFGSLMTAPQVVISSSVAPRFSARRAAQELDDAIAVVRNLFTAGSPEVLPFFDPNGAPHNL